MKHYILSTLKWQHPWLKVSSSITMSTRWVENEDNCSLVNSLKQLYAIKFLLSAAI